MSDELVFQARLSDLERCNVRLTAENALLEGLHARLGAGRVEVESADPLPLNVLTSICRQELTILNDSISKAKLEHTEAQESLRFKLDVAESTIARLKKDSFELRRDLVSKNPEVVLQYFENNLIESDTVIQNLRIKSVELQAKIRRAENTHKVSSDLQYIDFHQLQIENQQTTRQVAANKTQLESARSEVRAAQLSLKALKNVKEEEEAKVDSLRKEISKLQETVVESKTELVQVSKERDEAKKLDDMMSQVSSRQDQAIDPMKLIKQHVCMQELEKELKDLNRKLEIRRGVRSFN